MTIINPPTVEFPDCIDETGKSLDKLIVTATTFSKIITKVFSDATAGGKKFDDVLKQTALRLSRLSVQQALKPLSKELADGLNKIFDGVFGGTTGSGRVLTSAFGAIKPFAAGGVIGAPSYFPLSGGGLGLAGEAGPEAIVPLTRGRDGRLGVAMAGQAAAPNVTVQITTPDVASFQRSEAYVTGQIARAVARGQRGM